MRDKETLEMRGIKLGRKKSVKRQILKAKTKL